MQQQSLLTMNQRRLDPNFLNGPVTGANIPMLPGFRVPEQKRQYHGKARACAKVGAGPGIRRQLPADTGMGGFLEPP